MNSSVIYNATAGIDEKYLAASENAERIAGDFRRGRNRKAAAAFSLCACSAIALGGYFAASARFPETEPGYHRADEPADIWPYADRVLRHTDLTVDGHGIEIRSGSAIACFAAFSEEMLRDAPLIFEGTVLETHVKQYHITVEAEGKFEAAGGKMTITMDPESFVTTVRVDKIWKGGELVEVGDTVVIEDEIFATSGTCGYHEGTVCLFHLCEAPEDTLIYSGITAGEVLTEGDNHRESRWYNTYAHQPVIERTADGDYIVPAVWKTLALSSDPDVILAPEDVLGTDPEELLWFSAGFKLVSAEQFSSRMTALIDSLS